VRRVLLVLMVALVMAVMAVTVAMPAFGQAADPCTTGETPASPPDVGGSPQAPPPEQPPGTTVRQPPPVESHGKGVFTGPFDRCQSP
jgi:hypothetical protein